jgi:hypothetical protein
MSDNILMSAPMRLAEAMIGGDENNVWLMLKATGRPTPMAVCRVRAIAYRLLADILEDEGHLDVGAAIYVAEGGYGATVKMEGGDHFERSLAMKILTNVALENGLVVR